MSISGGAPRTVFFATVDEDRATIRLHGHVDRRSADLLRGTVEVLRERGHDHITLDAEAVFTVDADADELLTALADHLEEQQAQLVVR